MYYWYKDTSRSKTSVSDAPKVVLDFSSDKEHSPSSIESLEYSDNEGTTRKNMQKLNYEVYN